MLVHPTMQSPEYEELVLDKRGLGCTTGLWHRPRKRYSTLNRRVMGNRWKPSGIREDKQAGDTRGKGK